ncbi:uncharacterized protein B0I36DRAFT_367189 [Microdochium trichocladiopsis]|uniref:Uncharacterized protein n=1 Tax=Microdochium trichocladiopsis TaxID=1682393 RepID=A0A9P8XVH4_9PEZI|nr:uncharacterized protein B0I36DRAFT_367189 [Microdochium trichocladiopsis]KAH7020706.1 hypothetical protein B0I36DRAFT_367189 [Microdochium trichocladiopsis]
MQQHVQAGTIGGRDFNAILQETIQLPNKYAPAEGQPDDRKGGAWYAGFVNGDSRFYQYSRDLPSDPSFDPKKALQKPSLGFHYLNNLPGFNGMLLENVHGEIIAGLKAAKDTKELQELYQTDKVKKALADGANFLHRQCKNGSPLPPGTVAAIMSDMVIVRGHIVDGGAQTLILQTVSEKQPLDLGLAFHSLHQAGDGIAHSVSGIGSSPAPRGFSTANNITGVAMWSVTAIPGVVSFIADELGFESVDEFLE